jgi:hypothetical protein
VNAYEQNSIYKVTCQSCHKVYIRQTGWTLTTRYKELIRNIRFNEEVSAFAQHIPGKGHQYGPMEQIVEMTEYEYKGKLQYLSI